MILAVIVKFKTNHVDILKRFIEQKEKSDDLFIELLQTKMGRYKKKVGNNSSRI